MPGSVSASRAGRTSATRRRPTYLTRSVRVDLHVHRVGGRLGLFRDRAPFEEAHEEMRAITDPADAYELHVNLITHGRAICRPRPRCEECALRRMCPYWRDRV